MRGWTSMRYGPVSSLGAADGSVRPVVATAIGWAVFLIAVGVAYEVA